MSKLGSKVKQLQRLNLRISSVKDQAQTLENNGFPSGTKPFSPFRKCAGRDGFDPVRVNPFAIEGTGSEGGLVEGTKSGGTS